MIVKISALLFWVTFLLAKKNEMDIEVNVSKDFCKMYVGKSKYTKPIQLKSLEKMTKVTLFYIDGQETFLGFKNWGKSVHSLNSNERIDLKELSLLWQEGSGELVRFKGKVTMEHLDGNTSEYLEVKTLYVSEEELVIYVGEKKYFQIFLLRDQGTGSAKLTFGPQTSVVSMADFESFRDRTLEPIVGNQLPEAPKPALVKARINSNFEIDFFLVTKSDEFKLPTKKQETSQLHWYREKSAFVVVKIGADDMKGARMLGLSEPRKKLTCEIFEANPFFLLQTNQNIFNTRSPRHVTSISQEFFIEDFSCPVLSKFQTMTVSRRLTQEEIEYDRQKHPNEPPKNGQFMGTMKFTENRIFLDISGDDLKEQALEQTKDLTFDFSVLMGKENANIDLRLSREVTNRAVFFKVWTDQDATFLRLYTLDPNLKVVTRQFDLGKVTASRLRLFSAQTSKTKARLSPLNLVRKIRLHTNMFGSEDYCAFLASEFLVNKKAILVPSDGQADYGYIYQLPDEQSRLNTWQIYSYLQIEKMENPEDSSGLGDSLNLVLYDPATSALLTVEDTHSISLLARSPFSRVGDRVMLKYPLVRPSSEPFPEWEPSKVFIPSVQIVIGSEVKNAPALSLRSDSPKAILFHVRPEHHPFLNLHTDVVFRTHQQNMLSIFMYSTLRSAIVRVHENQVQFTFRHKSVKFDATQGFDYMGLLRVVLREGSQCAVLTTTNYGNTFDYPQDNFRLVDMTNRKIDLTRTQFFQAGPNDLVIVLHNSKELPLTNDQLRGLQWSQENRVCAIPTESELKFEIWEGSLSILHRTKDLRYIAPTPGIIKSEAATYQYGDRTEMTLARKELPEFKHYDGMPLTVLSGSVVDLNDFLHDSFFSPKASSFTYPAIILGQKESHLHLDFAHTPGKIQVHINAKKVVFAISDDQILEFHLSSPTVASKNSLDRFFKLKLQLLIDRFESVEALKVFPDTEGLDLLTFETDSFTHSFEVDANVAAPALRALAQRLGKANPKFAFAAYVFQSEAGEATLLVYEQTNFVYKKIIDGSLYGELDGPDSLQDKNKMQVGKKLMVNPKFFNKIPDYLRIEEDSNKVATMVVAKSKRPSVTIETRSSIPAVGNSLCKGDKCWTVAVYPELGGTTFHLLTKKGEVDEAEVRGAALTIRGTIAPKRIVGLQVVKPTQSNGLLI